MIDPAAWAWPQYVVAILFCVALLGAGIQLERGNGKGAAIGLAVWAIEIAALICGGFFH